VKVIFSQQGQEVIIKQGYFPVSASVAKEDLKRVGVEWTGG
jgi:hypothetical protein